MDDTANTGMIGVPYNRNSGYRDTYQDSLLQAPQWTWILFLVLTFSYRQHFQRTGWWLYKLCISQFQLWPSVPGNCGAFACLVNPGGGALAHFRQIRDLPTPRPHSGFSQTWFLTRNRNIAKNLQAGWLVCQELWKRLGVFIGILSRLYAFIHCNCLSSQNCYSEIRSDQRESTYVLVIEWILYWSRIWIKSSCDKLQNSYLRTDKLMTLKTCLHGGEGPQVGEVTRLGRVTRLSI